MGAHSGQQRTGGRMATSGFSLRGLLAGLFGTIGVMLVPITLVANWTEQYLLNTENFTNLYQPLSGKSSFQEYVAGELSQAASQAVEDSGLTEMAGTVSGGIDSFLGMLGFDSNLEGATDDWTGQIAETVGGTVHEQAIPAMQSPEFAEAWGLAIGQVHSQILTGLTGSGPETQALTLDAEPFAAIVQDYLGLGGFPLAQQLPSLASGVEIPLADVTYPAPMRSLVQALGTYGDYLPWLTGAFLLAGIILARRPWAAMARSGFAVAFTAGTLWLATPRLGRFIVTDAVSAMGDGSLAASLWQMGTAPLMSQALLVAAIALGVGILGLVVNLLVGSYSD